MAMDARQRRSRDGYDWFGREFKGIEAGDVFSVPLPDGSYVFGRQMNAKDGANIAEFFRARRNSPEFDPEVLKSGRLFGPVGILANNIEHGRRKRSWKVIHKDPEYYPDELYDLKFFRGTGPGHWDYFTLEDTFETLGPVSDADVDNWRVPPLLGQPAEAVEAVIQEQLKKQGL